MTMKIKWGVIGCGGIADRRTLPGMMLAENAELVAVMDTRSAAAEACRMASPFSPGAGAATPYCSAPGVRLSMARPTSSSSAPSAISATGSRLFLRSFMAASRQLRYSITASPSLTGRSSM